MLIKVTTQCSMGCTHCMECATPQGEHMELDIFELAMDLTRRVERRVHELTGLRPLMFSGGEPTEHPRIAHLIERAKVCGFTPTLVSNGLWLADEDKRDQILPLMPKGSIQVTNDPRFYPRKPPRIDDPRLIYEDSLSTLLPIGRFAEQSHPDLPTRLGPTSFNLRSFIRSTRDLPSAVALLRMHGKFCTPSICADGTVVAGESRFCAPIGTVSSSLRELTQRLLEFGSCNRCGLEDGLSDTAREAIGLQPVVQSRLVR